MNLIRFIFLILLNIYILPFVKSDTCIKEGILSTEKLNLLSRQVVPDLYSKSKGDAGRIAVFAGSVEFTGAPYFAAMASLRVGADLVFVITTESAAPLVKGYSPDLIVWPYLSKKFATKISQLLQKTDVVVIGPGLGKDDEQTRLTLDIIETCKSMKKPIVIDADGLFAISTNISVLNNYPKPGVILTPNNREALRLAKSIGPNNNNWYDHWGENVSVLIKGFEDVFHSGVTKFDWSLMGGGSERRAAGQGDILAGFLGTFYKWALDYGLCQNDQNVALARSVAAYAASKLTRSCNAHAYAEKGRNMIASDMLNNMHSAFNEIFV